MKNIIITIYLFGILSINVAAGGGGGSGGGGSKPSGDLLLSVGPNPSPQADFLLSEIDNIEISNQIRFPESLQEKIKLLKRNDIQSIQLINGKIISNR